MAEPTDHIALRPEPLDVAAVIARAESDGCGAVNVFIGTVRNQTSRRPVVRLEYEAYDGMARKEMVKIVAAARGRWPVDRVAIEHRKGTLEIGDVAVVVAVSTPHRAESFAACQFIIDTLKQTVPIWKKEFFKDGAVWVAAHP